MDDLLQQLEDLPGLGRNSGPTKSPSFCENWIQLLRAILFAFIEPPFERGEVVPLNKVRPGGLTWTLKTTGW